MTTGWDAQALRVTLFPAEAAAVSAEWWQEFTGSPPDNENRQPKDSIVVVSGAFEGKLLVISSGVGRIDVAFQLLIPNEVNALEGQIIPSLILGPAETLLDTMFKRLEPLCQRLPPVKRMALGGTFVRSVASRDEAYGELKGLLKSVTVDAGRMRDLIYRVNWPVHDTYGREIYRIGTWSSVTAKLGIVGQFAENSLISENHFVNFDADINTAPNEAMNLNCEEVHVEFSFLRKLLEENLKMGEVIG